MEMPFDFLHICQGAGVGVIVGLTGVGGGSLMTPALILLFGIHPVTAVGTDLLYAATTKSAGSIVHAPKKNVAWRVVALLALGSVPVAVATLVVLSHLGSQSDLMARAITTVLGAGAIGVTALLLLYPNYSTVCIVGTDIAHAVPLTLVAGSGHWLAGSVDLSMLLSLLAGSVPGIVLGSYLAPRVPEQGLHYALAGVLMAVGAKLVLS